MLQNQLFANNPAVDSRRRTKWEAVQATSHFSHSQPVLRGHAGSFGFERRLAANINFDLRGLGFGLLARLIFSTPLSQWTLTCPGIHEAGKHERAGKLPYRRPTLRPLLVCRLPGPYSCIPNSSISPLKLKNRLQGSRRSRQQGGQSSVYACCRRGEPSGSPAEQFSLSQCPGAMQKPTEACPARAGLACPPADREFQAHLSASTNYSGGFRWERSL
jgi:hypothetical protein